MLLFECRVIACAICSTKYQLCTSICLEQEIFTAILFSYAETFERGSYLTKIFSSNDERSCENLCFMKKYILFCPRTWSNKLNAVRKEKALLYQIKIDCESQKIVYGQVAARVK